MSREKIDLNFVASATHHTHRFGEFMIHVVKNPSTGKEHVVLTKGQIEKEGLLCRIASECLPGSVLDSADCECKEQLEYSLYQIAENGNGILIYLRQEGRGQGLEKKIQALANKNKGYDTFTAVEMLGEKADVREYWEVAEILNHFNVKSINLLTNNPDKVQQLTDEGIVIARVLPVEIPPTSLTRKHLEAKKERGHRLSLV